jgi:hypothetical protein
MLIREFGTEHKRHLLFFQGSCEPWIHFTPSAEALAKHFHVMLLTPDGHDPKEHNDFISVERTVDQAVGWLHANGIDHLDAVSMVSVSTGAW